MNQKRFIKIVLIVIVIVLAGAGIYYALNKQTMPSPTPSPRAESGSKENIPLPSVVLKFNPATYKYPFFAKIANQLIDRLK